ETPDEAFPVLMSNLLPSGLRGLVAAGLLAALMSSLASVFNSSSTLFTVDIYQKLRPNTPQKKLVRIGQFTTVIIVIIGIVWIPIMANISGVLYEYLQKIQSYIAPPITAVFLLGIFHKRINSAGALTTLIVGFIIGAFRIILELVKDSLNPEGILFYLGDMNYLTFGAWFFLFSILLLISVSLMTKPPSLEKTVNLTYGTITDEEKAKNKTSYGWVDIAISVVIVAVVAGIMIFFNGN
ncbi:MAG: hypothetical protein OEW75_15015, partial [Cyclobacteriaceae bacterium]|nr:hypothetical protein [Cyclobacteriaceae bacterium]